MAARIAGWRLRELKDFLLREDEEAIRPILAGLASDVIACVVKLMSNAGAGGGRPQGLQSAARLEDRRPRLPGRAGAAQLADRPHRRHPLAGLCGLAYAVGDLMLGTNPVSSDPDSVAAIEKALQEILATFGLTETLPHCVLAHIDVQAAAEAAYPGSTALFSRASARPPAPTRLST